MRAGGEGYEEEKGEAFPDFRRADVVFAGFIFLSRLGAAGKPAGAGGGAAEQYCDFHHEYIDML